MHIHSFFTKNQKQSDIKEFRYINFIGDSVSDRGASNVKKILGLIPLSRVLGLDKYSSFGRFTNGYSWVDQLGASIIENIVIKHLKSNGYSSADISDGILHEDPYILYVIKNSFNLKSHREIDFFQSDFIKTYCSGGLTSANYKGVKTYSPEHVVTRSVVSNLDEARSLIIEDAKMSKKSMADIQSTLTIEWSGVNDFVTVNDRPTRALAENAITAKIKNIEKLMEQGYMNFVLFNLPDLSCTPRYQQKNISEQRNANDVSNYFNDLLLKACKELKIKYKDCYIDIFDANTLFKNITAHPEAYRFNPKLQYQSYIKSKDFNIEGSSESHKYIFWDDIHPTQAIHRIIMEYFSNKYLDVFAYRAPESFPTKEEFLGFKHRESPF